MKYSLKLFDSRVKTFDVFQYYSDIHLETTSNNFKTIPVKNKNLILAGDIGNPYKEYYKNFLIKCSYSYENTYLVAGNHEYWYNDIKETNEYLDNMCNKLGNVHFLNRKSIKYDGYTILGCTLWTKIENKELKIGDNLYIQNKNNHLSIDKINQLHDKDLQWLESELLKIELLKVLTSENLISENLTSEKLKIEDKVIIITHHVPTYKLLDKKYDNKYYKKYFDRFYNNLDYLIKDPINTWVCGHSHCQMDIVLNNAELKINAIGYKN